MIALKSKPFPSLETTRLILRKPSLKDADAYHTILSNPQTSKYSDVPHNPTRKRSERFVSWMSKLHQRGNGIAWLIELKKEMKTIGAIRINRIENKTKCGYLGYEIDETCWNKGFATESLSELVKYAHSELELNRLEAWTCEGNDASDKVLIKNGFQYEGTQREKVYFQGKMHNIRLFARLKDDPLTQ